MKKILSCVMAFLAAVTLYATDLNIYASGLKVTTAGGSTVGIQYTLNAPATSLDLKILNGSTLVKTIAIPAGDGNVNFAKGTHNLNFDITDLAEGSYYWSIVASAAANGLEAPAVVNDLDDGAYQYYLPQDVAVDNSFDSPYFGRVYVCESTAGGNDGSTAKTQSQTRGIYIYNADLTLANGEATALTGYDGNIGGSGRTAFKRLAIGEDGYVYVSSRAAANKGVYRMDPANPVANFVTVLSASEAVDAIEVVGNTLYTFEGVGITGSTGIGNLNTYDLTTIPVGAATSTIAQGSIIGFVNADCAIRKDNRGGFWMCSYRGQVDYPMVAHMTEGVQNYLIGPGSHNTLLPNTYRGTMAVSPNGDMIAVGSNGKVYVFSVEYDAQGVPTLSDLYTISRTATVELPYIANTDGVAFDVAGNLYVACASNERFYAYAFPKAVNSFETPAPSSSMIVRSSTITHVTGISLDQTSASIEKGHTLTLVPTVVPGDASDPTVIWTSANDEIASVSNMGVVTAVAEGGPVTITATTQDGGFTATCEVTVFMNHVSSVTVEPNEITLGVGFKQQLTATVLPADATNKTYAWSSDDEAIATVVDGMVTAIAVGSTTIKATAEDGGIVGSCTVNVTPAVAHIGAYGLSVVKNAEDYTFSFNATMAATSGALEFYNKAGDKVGEIALADVVAGPNAKTVAFAELPGDPAQELTWAVRLSAADNAAFSKIHESEEITGRCHLVVDASPESPYMGRAYVFARNSKTIGGMYTVDQQFNISNRCNFGEDYNYGFMRPSIDETGKVWAMDWSDGHSGVWVIDPANPNAWTRVYQGTRQSSGLYKNGDVEVGGSGNACFVYGKGENRVLFANQEDFTDNSLGNHPVAIYNISSAYTWDAAPTAINVTPNNGNANNAIYAVEHGYWVSQNRSAGQNTSGASALQFFAMDGTLLANFGGDPRINGCAGAGFTVDPVNSKLYMVDGSSNILEFNVTYDAGTHVPTLELVGKHYVGYANISSMSMDFAGNLYVTAGPYASAASNKMRMVVFSPATNGDNTTITPAPKAATVSTPDVETLYMIGVDNWDPTVGTAMEKVSDNVFRCQVDFNATKYFAFSTVLADNNDNGGWNYVNAHRYAGTVADATLVAGNEMDLVYGVDRSMQMAAGKYIITVDLNTMKVTAEAVLAEHLYEIGNNQGWELANKVEMTKVENNVFEAELTFTDALSYFAFTTSSTSDWDDVNSHRYASDVYQERVDDGSEVNLLAGDGNASLTVLPGVYTIRVDMNTNKVTVTQSVAKVIVSAAGYATYYNSAKAYTMPEGMTGYAFNAANGLVEAYTAGAIVPADFPLVLAAAAGTYDLVFTEGGTPVDLASQLLGTDADATTTGPTAGEYKFYGLSLDTDNSAESVGFYYMEEDGAAFTNGAHKAYLAVPVAADVAPRYIFNGENNATGVENIEANEQAVKFIENGKLYIRKNGVVYDAKGAIVR